MLIDQNFRRKSASLMGWQHFQQAYVTTDLEQAMLIFGKNYGIEKFSCTRDFPLPTGGVMDVALAWAGNLNIEIIHSRGNPDFIFERTLPKTGFALQFHHLGYLVPDAPSWAALMQSIEEQKREVVFSGTSPEGLSWTYIEAPEMGHYLEYVLPGKDGATLLTSPPRY